MMTNGAGGPSTQNGTDGDDDALSTTSNSESRAQYICKIGQQAQERVNVWKANTRLPLPSKERQSETLSLTWGDTSIEDLLGVGSFASVCLVTVPKLQHLHNRHQDPCDMSSLDSCDEFFSEDGYLLMEDESTDVGQYYALKCLNKRALRSKNLFRTGAIDLATEALLLSYLSHEHIVKLHGIAAGGIVEANLQSGGFFFVMDALPGILSDLLNEWQEEKAVNTPRGGGSIPTLKERISSIAIGIAKGMDYLHGMNIVYRDLKPHNVGHDPNGCIKIFDFGLAREVFPPATTPATSPPFVPGVAGSLRYMAPETMVNQGCTFASDVFSFAILLWELCVIEKPYEDIESEDQLKTGVVYGNLRPPLQDLTQNPPMINLLRNCWDGDWKKRQSFAEISAALQGMLREEKTPLETSRHAMKASSHHSTTSYLSKSSRHSFLSKSSRHRNSKDESELPRLRRASTSSMMAQSSHRSLGSRSGRLASHHSSILGTMLRVQPESATFEDSLLDGDLFVEDDFEDMDTSLHL